MKRVGVVRVKATTDLFNTAGVLYSKRLPKSPRLAIITNAAGVGTMATHYLPGTRRQTCETLCGEFGSPEI